MVDAPGITRRIGGWLQRLAYWAAFIWVQLGVTILLFVLLSALSGAVVNTIRRARQRHEPAETAAYTGTASWAPAYFRAMHDVHMRWYPYVYWKTAPMRSPYLNIDRHSNRITWNQPPRDNGRPLLRVFCFGGSTTWGAGARDDYTIPSLLAKHLAGHADYDVEVDNFGQMGWVTSQELIYLYELLRRGQRPDLVIFYDGVNDTFIGYQNGIAGLTQSEFLRSEEFGIMASSSGRKKLYAAAIRTLLMNTGFFDLIKLVKHQDTGDIERTETMPQAMIDYLAPPSDFEGTDAVEQDVVNIYRFNQQMVETMGARFGFRGLFYWQPVIYSKSPLTPLERNFVGSRAREKFFAGTYKRIASVAPGDGINDISGILDNDSGQTYFIDAWHITEAGNDIVARRMASDAEPLLAQAAQARRQTPAPPAR
jgi:lysophospholipase L1-like esterase